MSKVRIHSKTLEIFGPSSEAYVKGDEIPYAHELWKRFDNANQKVVDEIDWEKIKDAMNDQLPKGFECKLRD